MTGSFAASPFGSAPLSFAAFSLARRLDDRRTAAQARQESSEGAPAGNDAGTADKWRLMTALSTARPLMNLSDRSLAVLTALVSALPGRELRADEGQIVFPSNAELSRRTQGMADATLRRHIAALVEAGLILRRDSPNGKRYARRGTSGDIEAAFGFDLGPLALRSAEIFALEEAVKIAEAKARRLRGEITIHIRDISKLLDAASEAGRAGAGQSGDWRGFALLLLPLARRMARTASLEALADRRDQLLALRTACETAWLEGLTDAQMDAQTDTQTDTSADARTASQNKEMSANDRHIERHIQNSNTESISESGFEKKLNEPVVRTGHRLAAENNGVAPERKGAEPSADGPAGTLPPLQSVKAACPSISDYARDGVRDWADLRAATDLVRPMLGISPDAWAKARLAFGPDRAAVVLACMLERSEAIRSAGGYLRTLTDKAAQGRFSVMPMLEALMNRS